MNPDKFRPLQDYIDTLPDPETKWEKFVVWIHCFRDNLDIRRAERRYRKEKRRGLRNDARPRGQERTH